ncbi:hypothetical protein D3OALGA1CA_907 [Olavius algarvensis associated proteobacterium Delta 3]|nr:hypothetical protein D3OALGA1CA_907 [Olavius algarvensis associated proteobacterium Delta 3]
MVQKHRCHSGEGRNPVSSKSILDAGSGSGMTMDSSASSGTH